MTNSGTKWERKIEIIEGPKLDGGLERDPRHSQAAHIFIFLTWEGEKIFLLRLQLAHDNGDNDNVGMREKRRDNPGRPGRWLRYVVTAVLADK